MIRRRTMALAGVPLLIGLNVQAGGAAAPLDGTESARILLGRSVFETQWVPPVTAGSGTAMTSNIPHREGLGPLYNATSCIACHPNGGRGAGPADSGPAPIALEVQLESTPTPGGGPTGDPVYGYVFNTTALSGLAPEGVVSLHYGEIYGYYYPDGARWSIRVPHYQLTQLSHGPLAPATVIKPRLAPPLFGVGLLESVPGARFGWQAEALSIRDQTARALAREMGVTSPDRPNDDCTSSEEDCLRQPQRASTAISEELLDALVAYERMLAVPLSLAHSKNAELGSQLFVTLGCAQCHQPQLPGPGGTQVNGVIAAYTDLLLHDLGSDMDDETVAGARVVSKWRTAPLWGLAYRIKSESRPTFLHDGRARSAEEAVLWHGGEAATARRQFMNCGPRSREALLRWLETL